MFAFYSLSFIHFSSLPTSYTGFILSFLWGQELASQGPCYCRSTKPWCLSLQVGGPQGGSSMAVSSNAGTVPICYDAERTELLAKMNWLHREAFRHPVGAQCSCSFTLRRQFRIYSPGGFLATFKCHGWSRPEHPGGIIKLTWVGKVSAFAQLEFELSPTLPILETSNPWRWF